MEIILTVGAHPNVVSLLGAHTKTLSLCIMMEYCPYGDLQNFLRSKRDIFKEVWFKNEKDMVNELTYIDLAIFCFQIAKGMDYLTSKHVSLTSMTFLKYVFQNRVRKVFPGRHLHIYLSTGRLKNTLKSENRPKTSFSETLHESFEDSRRYFQKSIKLAR